MKKLHLLSKYLMTDTTEIKDLRDRIIEITSIAMREEG